MLDGVPVGVGVSLGVALFPQHADEADALLSAADAALYDAKREGKGRACVAREQMTRPPERGPRERAAS
jgi:predicted signal transduction protein with EAL and GGDEF domain